MKRILTFGIFILFTSQVLAQLKFVSRFEVQGQAYDPVFEMQRIPGGLVSFRTFLDRSISNNTVFQYFVSDTDLNTPRLISLPLKQGYEMIGYDADGLNLFVLLSKGLNTGADKYILQVNLETSEGFEYPATNILPLELVEFLVQKRKAVFMGNSEGRPVIQIFDLDDQSIRTVQGIYGNNTQVMQIRKMPELESLEVVVHRKGQYKNLETSILTFDMQGNLVREVMVDKFGEPGQEILEGLLLADRNYQQVMIGSYGLEGRSTSQGMYIMEINEFGEYDFKLYTLEDFPNFYNYLGEKQKAKRDKEVAEELEKGKIPSIRNTYSIRDVRETEDAYYLYFDQLNIISSRGGRPGAFASSNNPYRYDRMSRMGYAPYYMDPEISPNMPVQTFGVPNEYEYESAHFIKVAKTGEVIWENSAKYNNFITSYPEPFGEFAIVGDDLFHLYAENDQIMVSFFRNGERIFEHETFPIELTNENERIRYTDFGTLRLVHWYDRYFILTGQQTIRSLGPDGREQIREVFFMSKILLDGDLYQPKEEQD